MKLVAYTLAALFLASTFSVGQAANQPLATPREASSLKADAASNQHREASDPADVPAARKAELKADQKYDQRIYRVADLIRATKNPAHEGETADGDWTAKDLAPIMNYLQTKVAPATWGQTRKGNATLAPYPKNASLVIFQSRHVHEEIGKELARLREAYQVIDQFAQLANAADMPTK
ncbi:hypothetical protein [Roseimaritima sediminicola]|uniref:hypothetical protein n=1 Tax=Roseimaritima sediminicola TaxID=2662066 RepID=UPI0012984F75|nr:hypothetical protein [Roseimaritima sediminicola]